MKPGKARTREDWQALDQSQKSDSETDIRIINNNINKRDDQGSQESVEADSSDLGFKPDRRAVREDSYKVRDGLSQ